MKKWVILLSAAMILVVATLPCMAREKYYEVRIGRLYDVESPMRPCVLPTWTYNSLLHFTQVEWTDDFATGVLVPVEIVTHGKMTIETDKACWADFVTVDVRFARMKKAEREHDGDDIEELVDYDGDDIEELVQPASRWKSRLFSKEWNSPGGMGAVIDFHDDKVWFMVEFDNPELLEDGNYVFLPRVDFDGIAKVLPDLAEQNFSGEREFVKDEFYSGDFIEHNKRDLATPAGRRNAINMRLLEADRMYGFGKRAMSLGCIRDVFEIDPDSSAGWFTLGQLHYTEKDFEKALECMHKGLDAAENGTDDQLDEERRSYIIFYLCMKMGRCCLVLRQFDDAEYFYLKARETLNDRAMDPGCAIDDHWGGQGAYAGEYADMARKGESLDE